ncbi:MAG: Retaining alpha-galactosidase precursor [Paenibacillaceae bacterium]|jgi:alpha-glucosidase|nr:Retaining alpha-galactosidase precursor [Paenibacillaceae bacterium]
MDKDLALFSPDGKIELRFAVKDKGKLAGCPVYQVHYSKQSPAGGDATGHLGEKEALLLDSAIGLVLKDGPPLTEHFRIRSVSTDSIRNQWRPLYGERSLVTDHYNELTVELVQRDGSRGFPETAESGITADTTAIASTTAIADASAAADITAGRCLLLTFRAYNEGIAFRYTIPAQEGIGSFIITAEKSQFHFPPGCYAYQEHGCEGEYFKVPVEELADHCERPLTVEYRSGTHVCLTEANLGDYSRMLLSRDSGEPGCLVSSLSGMVTDFPGYGDMKPDGPVERHNGEVRGEAPFSTPWRMLIIGDRPGDLPERNDIVLNLNPPCALEETDWIKPGKAIREVTLSTEGGMALADFAAAHGMQYIEYDAGWYGHEYDEAADARQVQLDPDRVSRIPGHKGLDLQKVIDYAGSKGIGVFLYVNRRALEKQLDQLLPLYAGWGVKGIKFGFVNVGSQYWTNWLLDAVRKCARYKLLVDIHDGYRPTGFSRTYPNLLTQEGIRGNEHMPSARHNATLPFTRFPAGAGDYTVCYYDKRLQTTHAHQLAMSVIVYSPLQFLYWYDKPYLFEPGAEAEFFAALPTVWDDTKVLDGRVGEYAVVVRRQGESWFIGCITNEYGRELPLSLDFLPEGKSYEAKIFSDGMEKAGGSRGIEATAVPVSSATVLTVSMVPGGGQALMLRMLP